MSHESFTPQHRAIGMVSTFSVSLILVAYAVTTILGFFSLKSPMDPIGDPYFTIMELLIIIIALLLTLSMIAVHAYASSEVKVYSLTALVFMIILTGITSSVHFVILSVSHEIETSGLAGAHFLFSFKWPSVIYALDILAWDWFFALSMIFAAPVFKGNRLETAVRILMFISGILSLVGLIGVPLANMQVRNIGIIGYALVSIVIFILLGIVFGRTRCVNGYSE